MDIATIVGIVLSLAAVAGGDVLEGGHLESLLQPTAAIIVFGGTIGACILQFPGPVLLRALKDLKQVFLPMKNDPGETVRLILNLAQKARREGLVSIERDAASIEDAFLRRGLELAVDGADAKDLRAAMEMELSHFEEEGEGPSKVMEAAGGYSPTVGILGAVLGLIHVMENLSDPSKLGAGIAVAFVATVYGVGSANLIYLPMSAKLKSRLRERVSLMELSIEAVCALAAGENPRLIERKLAVFAGEGHGDKKEAG